MDKELERILNSNLENEVIQQLESNQTQMEKLERLLGQKNGQVFQLHQMINSQMQGLIKENDKLFRANQKYKKLVVQLRKNFNQLKVRVNGEVRSCYSLVGACIKTMCEEFQKINCSTHFYKHQDKSQRIGGSIRHQKEKNDNLMNQLIQTELIEKIGIHTQTQRSFKNNNNHLLERLEKLQQKVITLKQQKWNLEKELSKYQNFQSVGFSQKQYSSRDSINEQEKRLLVCQHFQQGFKKLQQTKFCGQLVGNVKNGEGCCEYDNKFVYEGIFVNGKRQGLGEIRYDGELVYRGQWRNDVPEGKGVLLYLPSSKFDRYCGNFKNGNINGFGTLIYQDGRRIVGKFDNGILKGASLLEDEENGVHFGCVKDQQFTSERTCEVFAI